MINKQILIGHIGQDPELRYTPGGTAICSASLATNHTYKDGDGEKVQETTWHDLEVWSASGEAFAEHVRKGSALFIEGRLKKEWWEGDDGVKRLSVRTTVERWQFLPGNRRNGRQGEAQEEPEEEPERIQINI